MSLGAIKPVRFRLTTFANGKNFLAMTGLSDGSTPSHGFAAVILLTDFALLSPPDYVNFSLLSEIRYIYKYNPAAVT